MPNGYTCRLKQGTDFAASRRQPRNYLSSTLFNRYDSMLDKDAMVDVDVIINWNYQYIDVMMSAVAAAKPTSHHGGSLQNDRSQTLSCRPSTRVRFQPSRRQTINSRVQLPVPGKPHGITIASDLHVCIVWGLGECLRTFRCP